MSKSVSLVDIGLLGVGIYLIRLYLQSKNPANRLPPGPSGLPIVGNVADMPKEKEWLTFREWGRKYGGICSVKLFGRPMVIINSAEIMEEFDKKGAIYSQRPRLEMGGELMGYSETLVLIPYGGRFRNYRKQFSHYIGNTVIHEQHSLITEHVRTFLKNVLKDHTKLMWNLRKLTGGIILELTYGYQIQAENDPFITLIEGANENFSAATVPGTFVVDFFPSLAKLPEWLPGMGFLEIARTWRKDTDDMVEVPFNYTKQHMASGQAPPSFVSTSLEAQDKMTEQERKDIKLIASSLYGGGADTTVSAEYAFFLAMVLRPDVQKRAQAEIDAVTGGDRLPTYEDRAQLPFVNAILTEVLRWNSVAPSGVPHVAIEDGYIGGYFIPKGAMILSNLWGMLHDPEMYPDPFTFEPERFLGSEPQPDPRNICFGWGRRICPGRFLAEASLFAAISMSLAVFDIANAIEDGKPIIPVHENTSGTISYPKPFKCIVKPRSSRAVALINE